jgi:hypothetical protein
MTDSHVGRTWSDNRLEQLCPCPLERCGLVALDKTHPECEEHTTRARTMRQIHEAADCPGPRPFHPAEKGLAVGDPEPSTAALAARDIAWRQDPRGVQGCRFIAYEHPYSFTVWGSPVGQAGFDVTDRTWPEKLLVRTDADDLEAAKAECQRFRDELVRKAWCQANPMSAEIEWEQDPVASRAAGLPPTSLRTPLPCTGPRRAGGGTTSSIGRGRRSCWRERMPTTRRRPRRSASGSGTSTASEPQRDSFPPLTGRFRSAAAETQVEHSGKRHRPHRMEPNLCRTPPLLRPPPTSSPC